MSDPRTQFDSLIGQSPVFRNVIQAASKIAPHDVPILIEGEAGSGKGSLARAIHFASPRAGGEFVTVDCVAENEKVLECELFGYVRGSFAGAIHDKKGIVEFANRGTLFLNQISKLNLSLQAKMIRLMNERNFYRLGGVSAVDSNVRIIAATEQDLKPLVERGRFREDLYYQLNAMRITLPPLRERREDILLLADHFLEQAASHAEAPRKEFTQEVRSLFLSYDWPGNVRELEREIERSAIMAEDHQKIGMDHFPDLINRVKQRAKTKKLGVSVSGSLKDQKKALVAALEKDALREALKKTNGNRTQAARLLSISRQELIRKLSAYKIKVKP